ncbi:hypothetical protein CRH02_14085 [Escherichia albertii]|nr:hypothetical protein CRH02_14085 [Escherichia albertii]
MKEITTSRRASHSIVIFFFKNIDIICDTNYKTDFVVWIVCFLIWYDRYKGIHYKTMVDRRESQ